MRAIKSLLMATILFLASASTCFATTEAEYEKLLAQCAVIAQAEKMGAAKPETCYQCYWIAQSASVYMESRDGRFKAKQLMKILKKYKNY